MATIVLDPVTGVYKIDANDNGNFEIIYDVNGGTVTIDPDDDPSTNNNIVVQLCFMAGTMIKTAAGEVAVESLKAGDLVLTTEGREMPVRWLGRQNVSLKFADASRSMPICIKAGALGDNVPSRDLFVSPGHAFLVDGILAQAGALVNGVSIVRHTAAPETFCYYNIELDEHALVLAEGAAAETFVDNASRENFDNWAEREALGTVNGIVEMDLPRAKSFRQVPAATHQRLAERAAEIFGLERAKAA